MTLQQMLDLRPFWSMHGLTVTGVLFLAAAGFLTRNYDTRRRSPSRIGQATGHIFLSASTAAGGVGFTCLVLAEGWSSIAYLFAAAFAVVSYLHVRSSLFQSDCDRLGMTTGCLLILVGCALLLCR